MVSWRINSTKVSNNIKLNKMNQKDWIKMNEISHYKSLIKQDIEHRKVIKRLQLEKKDLKKQLRIANVGCSLPSVDYAGVIAVNVASNVRPKLTAQEEAMFVAGFQECVKYLSMQGKSEQLVCELYDFGRKDKPCDKQCDGCKAMNLD